MTRIRADGDEWQVGTDDPAAGSEVLTYVFHCLSNPQRPYRVVQVPRPVVGRGAEAAELVALFARTQTMDFSHDRAASPESHGYGDPPLQ